MPRPSLIVGVLAVCPAAMTDPVSAEPLIIAHRGASHDAPENTIAAFEIAWRQGADGIEGDFRLTADGRIVCLHDADTKRTGDRTLVANESTLAELQAIDVGAWKGERFRGERPPSLEQVLATVPAGKRVFVEIKSGAETVAPLERALNDSGLAADQVVIISFSAEVIAACEARMPEYATQWLTSYKETDGGWSPTAAEVASELGRSGADGLGCKAERRCFDEAFVATLREQGLRAFGVWTVDNTETARYYRSLGAWSITTNRPGWLRERLGE